MLRGEGVGLLDALMDGWGKRAAKRLKSLKTIMNQTIKQNVFGNGMKLQDCLATSHWPKSFCGL